MRLYVKVQGRPAIIVGYANAEADIGVQAIVIGLEPYPLAVPLSECELPKLPKRLKRKLRAVAKRETQDAMVASIRGFDA